MSDQAYQESIRRIRELITIMASDKFDGAVHLDDDTPLFLRGETLNPLFDSFDAVMILVELERLFGFQIPEQDMNIEQFNSIRQMNDYVHLRLASDPQTI